MMSRSPSRRDVLASFLGAAAAASCRSKGSPELDAPRVEGTLVEDLHLVGHRLQDAPPPHLATEAKRVEVAVVGAGVAGLSAAWRLAAAGHTAFCVLEVDEQPGGTSKAGANAHTAFPWGAHYVPAPLSAAGPVPRLFRELGLLTGLDDAGRPIYAEEALVHEPEERLFYRGRWYEGLYLRAGASPDDLAQLARFEGLVGELAGAVDGRGRKAFAVPLETGSDDAEWTQLDAMTADEWLSAQGFTSPRLRWLVDYACRDDFGAGLASTSAWAALWYFAARRTVGAESAGYLTWPEGNAHLVAHLAAEVGRERHRSGTLVHTVAREGAGWRVSGVEAGSGAPMELLARHVILATPRFIAARLVAPWRASPPAFLAEFEASPWVVANLHLRRRPSARGAPLAWDNVLYESRSLGYVLATHQRLRADESGPTVLTWYYPLSGVDPKAERRRLLETRWEDWRSIVLADLLPAHRDLGAAVERLDVLRWGHAMVRPRPGFIWSAARRQASTPLDGTLHFAHSDLSGMALFEEAMWHGVRAAEAVLSSLRPGAPSWL